MDAIALNDADDTPAVTSAALIAAISANNKVCMRMHNTHTILLRIFYCCTLARLLCICTERTNFPNTLHPVCAATDPWHHPQVRSIHSVLRPWHRKCTQRTVLVAGKPPLPRHHAGICSRFCDCHACCNTTRPSRSAPASNPAKHTHTQLEAGANLPADRALVLHPVFLAPVGF